MHIWRKEVRLVEFFFLVICSAEGILKHAEEFRYEPSHAKQTTFSQFKLLLTKLPFSVYSNGLLLTLVPTESITMRIHRDGFSTAKLFAYLFAFQM